MLVLATFCTSIQGLVGLSSSYPEPHSILQRSMSMQLPGKERNNCVREQVSYGYIH